MANTIRAGETGGKRAKTITRKTTATIQVKTNSGKVGGRSVGILPPSCFVIRQSLGTGPATSAIYPRDQASGAVFR